MKTHHHLNPVSRFGKKKKGAVIILDWERHHVAWHQLFSNLSIMEAIRVLQKIAELKKVHQDINQIKVFIE